MARTTFIHLKHLESEAERGTTCQRALPSFADGRFTAFMVGVGSVFDVSGNSSMAGIGQIFRKPIRQALLDDRLQLHNDNCRALANLTPEQRTELGVEITPVTRMAPRDARVMMGVEHFEAARKVFDIEKEPFVATGDLQAKRPTRRSRRDTIDFDFPERH